MAPRAKNQWLPTTLLRSRPAWLTLQQRLVERVQLLALCVTCRRRYSRRHPLPSATLTQLWLCCVQNALQALIDEALHSLGAGADRAGLVAYLEQASMQEARDALGLRLDQVAVLRKHFGVGALLAVGVFAACFVSIVLTKLSSCASLVQRAFIS